MSGSEGKHDSESGMIDEDLTLDHVRECWEFVHAASPEDVVRRLARAEASTRLHRRRCLQGDRGQEEQLDEMEAYALGLIGGMMPDAIKGREMVSRLREQSKNRRGEHKVQPEQLKSEVRAAHEKTPTDSWTKACDKVGRKHNISGRQVRRLVPDTRW